jgi:hypothetical protein
MSKSVSPVRHKTGHAELSLHTVAPRRVDIATALQHGVGAQIRNFPTSRPSLRTRVCSKQTCKQTSQRGHNSRSQPALVGPWPLFQFLNPIHSRQDSLDGGSARRKTATYSRQDSLDGGSASRKTSTYSRQDSLDGGSASRKTATYTQNKRTQTSMPRVRVEPGTPLFERAHSAYRTQITM